MSDVQRSDRASSAELTLANFFDVGRALGKMELFTNAGPGNKPLVDTFAEVQHALDRFEQHFTTISPDVTGADGVVHASIIRWITLLRRRYENWLAREEREPTGRPHKNASKFAKINKKSNEQSFFASSEREKVRSELWLQLNVYATKSGGRAPRFAFCLGFVVGVLEHDSHNSLFVDSAKEIATPAGSFSLNGCLEELKITERLRPYDESEYLRSPDRGKIQKGTWYWFVRFIPFVMQLSKILQERPVIKPANARPETAKAEGQASAGEIAEEGGGHLKPLTRKSLMASLKARFSFLPEDDPSQACFDDEDLKLPTGIKIQVLKKLVESFGKPVPFPDLDVSSRIKKSVASQDLRDHTSTINIALKDKGVPCEIKNLRGSAYVIQPIEREDQPSPPPAKTPRAGSRRKKGS